MEHRWGKRSNVLLPIEVRGIDRTTETAGTIMDMSISGALIRTPLDVEAFTGLQIRVNHEWILAWVTRRAGNGLLAIEWMVLAPDPVARYLEVSELPRPSPDVWAVA